MSIRIMSQIWDDAPAEGNALLVLLALSDFSNDDGWCWPSVATIARKARISERGARGILRRLEADSLLVCELSKGRASSRYRVITDPEAASGLTPSNPEDSDIQPGSPLPPNLKRTITKKDSEDSTKKGTRLLENWTLPKHWGTWAMEQGQSMDQVRCQADKFLDYWIAIPGQRGVKINWQATWRNWIRSATERGSYSNGGQAGRGEPMTASDYILLEHKQKQARLDALKRQEAG